jgi:hypothetical protein
MEIDMTDLTAALEALRPELAAIYDRQVRGAFERIVADLGADLKNVYNDWTHARTFRGLVAPALTDKKIDEAKLAKLAAMYAAAATDEWKAKIEAKLGGIENVQIRQFNGCNFLIGGLRAGRKVSIDQNIIVKRSTKGLLFNQFPARIYVDGKFTPEKQYHAIFA